MFFSEVFFFIIRNLLIYFVVHRDALIERLKGKYKEVDSTNHQSTQNRYAVNLLITAGHYYYFTK